MKRVLVTGGAGFIGSAFVRAAIAERWHVFVLDRFIEPGRWDNLPSDGDIVAMKQDAGWDPASDFVRAVKPDVVVHMAAESHVDRSIDSPSATTMNNMRTTAYVLEATRQHAPKATFLYVSTDEVFGQNITTGLFNEESRYAPNSPYAASKAAGDHLVRAYHKTYGLRTVTTHCTNNYGPRQHPEKFIPTIISALLGGRKVPIYGDGQQERDWIWVYDHVEALLRIIDWHTPQVREQGTSGTDTGGVAYCIGARNRISNMDLVRKLAEIMNKPIASAAERVQDRPGHDRSYGIDPSKVERLGWKPKMTFDDGLRETVKWYTAHRERLTEYDNQRLGLVPL